MHRAHPHGHLTPTPAPLVLSPALDPDPAAVPTLVPSLRRREAEATRHRVLAHPGAAVAKHLIAALGHHPIDPGLARRPDALGLARTHAVPAGALAALPAAAHTALDDRSHGPFRPRVVHRARIADETVATPDLCLDRSHLLGVNPHPLRLVAAVKCPLLAHAVLPGGTCRGGEAPRELHLADVRIHRVSSAGRYLA